MMSTATTELVSTIGALLRLRSMGRNHYAQLIQHLESFARFAGDDLSALNSASFNGWLTEVVLPSSRASKTKAAYRASVLNACRTAATAGLAEAPPLSLLRVSIVRCPPVAWTHSELVRLLAAASSDRDALWAEALIRVTWSTGLRRCDCYGLSLDLVDDHGFYRLVQQKTGLPHCVHVSDEATEALKHLGGRLTAYTRGRVSRLFRRLTAASGVRPGTARWLRRSAASYVEKERPGDGRLFLGHSCSSIAARHYFDPAISGRVVRGPSLVLPRAIKTVPVSVLMC